MMEDVLLDLAHRIRRNEVVFFLGAGASCDAPAGLPTSMSLVGELAALVALPSLVASKEEVANRITKGVRFEVFIQTLATVFGAHVIEALGILDTGEPNFNHEFIARLAVHKLCPFVLTTNFDSFIEKALNKSARDFESWYLSSHYKGALTATDSFKVLKLHGSLRDQKGRKSHSSIVISVKQVGKPIPRAKRNTLRKILKEYDVVFLGYSGLDDFDLLPIILTTKSDKAVFWIKHEQSRRMTYINSTDLRTDEDGALLDNHERIVASRKNGVLVRSPTLRFISELNTKLFGRSVAKPRGSRQRKSFHYLAEWEKRVELFKHKAFINALLRQRLGDYSEAVEFFDQVLHDSPFLESALYNKAVSLRHSNRIDQARSLLKELTSGSRWSRTTRMKALVQLGLLETEQTNFSLARRHLGRALRMKPIDTPIVVAAHSNLGMCYLLEAEGSQNSDLAPSLVKKAVRKAVHHLNLARKFIGRDGDPQGFANISGNLGLAYVFLKQFKYAERCLFEALRLFRSLYVTSEEASCLDNIGYFYKEKALSFGPNSAQYRYNLEAALLFSRKAHSLKKRRSTPRRLAISKHGIGVVCHLLGRNNEALRWLESSKKIFDAEGLYLYSEDVARAIERIQNAITTNQPTAVAGVKI